MRISLITGFLGAGKTTFLRRFLVENRDLRVGVIVNDLSTLEVDGELVRMGHCVSEEEGTLVSLTAGSISGSQQERFMEALEGMFERGLEHVIVETSGGTEPQRVIELIQKKFPGKLHTVATFIDGRALYADFEGGRSLLGEGEGSGGQGAAAEVMVGQIECATLIVLTKLDLVPETALQGMLKVLQTLRPDGMLVGCSHGKLRAEVILESAPYDVRVRTEDVTRDVVGSIKTRVIRDERPLHPQRFYDLYNERLGMGLFRSKGFLWFVSRPGQVLLWNQAGGAMGLEFMGTWKAEILEKDRRLLKEEKDLLRERLGAMHPVFGDRSCELTLIGYEADLEIFGNELLGCFCTDEEVERWLAGGQFPDPWPANLKAMG